LEFLLDAFLFVFDLAGGDGVVVEQLDDFESFGFQLLGLFAESGAFFFAGGVDAGEDFADHPFQSFGGFGADLDGLVMLLDEFLYGGHEGGVGAAAVRLGVSNTHEDSENGC
jgi:hypothetical protein